MSLNGNLRQIFSAAETVMAKLNFDDLIKSIADETDTPRETVSEIYAQTWNEFSDGARITDYLPLLVAKRVRERLRNKLEGKN
jgi:hypothetical protein